MEYDKLSELAQRVITGKATIARLDKDEEQGRIAGGRRNVEATVILGASFEHHQSQQYGSGWTINQEAARQKAVLKAYTDELLKHGAKLWYSEANIEEIKKQSIAQAGGAEADVYFMPNGKVIKVVEHILQTLMLIAIISFATCILKM